MQYKNSRKKKECASKSPRNGCLSHEGFIVVMRMKGYVQGLEEGEKRWAEMKKSPSSVITTLIIRRSFTLIYIIQVESNNWGRLN